MFSEINIYNLIALGLGIIVVIVSYVCYQIYFKKEEKSKAPAVIALIIILAALFVELYMITNRPFGPYLNQ